MQNAKKKALALFGKLSESQIDRMHKESLRKGIYVDQSGDIFFQVELYKLISQDRLDCLIEVLIRQQLNDQSHLSKQLFTPDEVATELNMSKKTLQKLRDNGEIEFTRIGRKIYFTKQSVSTFIEQKKQRRHGRAI